MSIKIPSFRTKDMSDEFYFVGRLKEQVLETKSFDRSDGSGSFEVVSLRVVHERLDAETVTPRYSFYRVPQSTVSPRSPLGQYLSGMEAAGTPINFGATTLETANEQLDAQVGTVYVLCQKSIAAGKSGREPDRYCLPIAQVGYGNDWDPDEAKRIISEARGISPEATSAEPELAGVSPQTAPVAPEPTTAAVSDESIVDALRNVVAGHSPEEAKSLGIAWVQANRTGLTNPNELLVAITRGDWAELGLDDVIAA